MRPVTLNVDNVRGSLQEIDRASHDNDPVEIAQNITFDAAVTKTLALAVASPTLANTNAVLATLIQMFQRGGLNRTT